MNPSAPLHPSTTRSHRAPALTALLLAVLIRAAPLTAAPLPAAPLPYAERMHARAVESFRQGRFPEAYGRFIDLANWGHAASARYALWMCEHGMALFGKDWDCAPHQVEDWSRAAGVAQPSIVPPDYSASVRSTQPRAR
jgi:hypothetical protein